MTAAGWLAVYGYTPPIVVAHSLLSSLRERQRTMGSAAEASQRSVYIKRATSAEER